MLDELRQKYRFSSGIAPAVPSASAVHASGPVSCTRAAACYEKQAGMLALKDILYQTWKNRKRGNRITRGGRFFGRPPFLQGRRSEAVARLCAALRQKGKWDIIQNNCGFGLLRQKAERGRAPWRTLSS